MCKTRKREKKARADSYGIIRLFKKKNITEIFSGIFANLPAGYGYPHLTAARNIPWHVL